MLKQIADIKDPDEMLARAQAVYGKAFDEVVS